MFTWLNDFQIDPFNFFLYFIYVQIILIVWNIGRQSFDVFNRGIAKIYKVIKVSGCVNLSAIICSVKFL